MRGLLLTTALAFGSVAHGQYDVGLSIGVSRHTLVAKKSQGRGGASFYNIDQSAMTAAIFYRERVSAHVDLGVEAQVSHKRFSVYASDGSLAGSYGIQADADLWFAHLNITPEVRMNARASAVIRFGPQIGFKLGGSMTGRRWSQFPYSSSEEHFENAKPDVFTGDIRFLFGLGFRTSTGTSYGMTIDPYVSAAITSLLKQSPGCRGTELGVRIGIAIRCKGEPFTRWLDKRLPTPPSDGGNW
jgi:hypothetical protein